MILNANSSPVDLTQELAASRAETDRLFHLVSADDIYVRPLPQRHRLIFYMGHLEAFDWNQVAFAGLTEKHLDPSLDRLFARGIDPEPGQLPADQPKDWPTLEETRSYVNRVRGRLDALWDEAPVELQQTAVEHRWMHAETLTYLLHNLPPEQKRRPAGERVDSAAAAGDRRVEHGFVPIPRGRATLGRERGSGFGWDNEFDELVEFVPAFAIARYKVTNGEYLEFVKQGQTAPHFWTERNGKWFYRGMFELTPLALDAPVYVTEQQAAAFAAWRGATLPTEAQYHRAAFGTPSGEERDTPWHPGTPESELRGNFDFRHWDPVSVASDPAGRSAFGVEQLIGNGWEWTRTAFAPFPGFAPKPNYPGYSADFFDGKHFVMKGASPRTAALLTRRSLRNWFRPDYPYVYGTFRLVEN